MVSLALSPKRHPKFPRRRRQPEAYPRKRLIRYYLLANEAFVYDTYDDTMSGKYAFTKSLKELRFLFCQTSEVSAPVRYVALLHG